MKKDSVSIIVFFVVLIVLVLVSIIFASDKVPVFNVEDIMLGNDIANQSKSSTNCTSSVKTQPQEYVGWKTSLYSTVIGNAALNDDVPDNGVRVFSLESFQNGTSINSVYYHIQKIDNSYIAGAKALFEICNNDNQTLSYSTTTTANVSIASKQSLGVFIHLNDQSYMPTIAGNYRLDAYLYADSAWHLTNRMSIKLNK